MERLTKRLEDGRARVINMDLLLDSDKLYELIDRLAAYEDTGLDPEEINGLKLKLESSEMSLRVACDALENFTNAEQNGQLVVLEKGERNGQRN